MGSSLVETNKHFLPLSPGRTHQPRSQGLPKTLAVQEPVASIMCIWAVQNMNPTLEGDPELGWFPVISIMSSIHSLGWDVLMYTTCIGYLYQDYPFTDHTCGCHAARGWNPIHGHKAIGCTIPIWNHSSGWYKPSKSWWVPYALCLLVSLL